jgi:hypothetical protein
MGGGIYSILVVHTSFGNQHFINIVEKISVFLKKVDPSIHP